MTSERDGPPQFLSEMDEIERRYTLAIHDVYCDEKPVGHTAMAHEPFDGVDDPDELVPWSAVVAALAAHGLVLASAGAGHRTAEAHDCFLMNCAGLGEEVASLQARLAAARGEPRLREAATETLAALDATPADATLETWVRFQGAILALRAALATPTTPEPDQ